MFESGFQLWRIDEQVLHDRSPLESICIPRSVEEIGEEFFSGG
jgi:hypothetical protein